MLTGFEDGYAEVNGTVLHYVSGGHGKPLVLLPGWPMTWWEYHKVMPALARRHRVIAVDLRGMGDSGKPATGYDKKTMAADIAGLVRALGYDRVDIAGNDIGAMVAFSFAVNHPELTRRLAMIEVPHPDTFFYQFTVLPQPGQPHLWWFAFNQVEHLPEALLQGRARLLIDWCADQMSRDPAAVDENSRAIYAAAYDQPGAIRAANGWYQAFPQDIEDMQTYGELTMPVLALGGLYYPAMPAALKGKASRLQLLEIPDAGHYLAQERPHEVAEALTNFFE
ncbi:alpha/beta hydrolase [Actinoplanes sp. TBRC 11911]|uniref:alpha/beta fold hydrolase n=1 Tax=Actinoplanes sp. TBRC 11911 TaxID=2729386 RepID=UPI00145CB7DD|nr:alpha/beta hydrolase [Actinoplanes sp. TBRC 11911]NMO49807.1 alpha/beta hydrolase [Actinoplanes sp. TBRC 11911]